jgi:glutathione S-transferase
MNDQRPLTFFHAPNSRSSGVLALLEEIGAEYELRVLNLKAGEQRAPAYLAVNPMGKVPALLHGDALITEQVAVYLYLADLYPDGGLAPRFDDPLRGPYLRWLAFYGSCFEPAVIDRAMKRDPALAWTTGFGLVPASPPIERYVQAVQSRPAMARARARDAELATAQA